MNGKEISNSEMSGHFAHPLRSTAVLRLGTNGRNDVCHLAFDDVHVGSIVRTLGQLGFHAKEPLQPDRHTTLLLNFDNATENSIEPAFAATRVAPMPLPFVVPEPLAVTPRNFFIGDKSIEVRADLRYVTGWDAQCKVAAKFATFNKEWSGEEARSH